MHKIVRIGFLGCPGCIITDNAIQKVKKEFELEVIHLDIDFDDVSSYEVKDVLPVVYINDKRFEGEMSYEEIISNLS